MGTIIESVRSGLDRVPWVAAHLIPGQLGHLMRRARQARRRRDFASAAEAYEEATRRWPRSSAAWLGLGIANAESGGITDSIRALEQALSLRPGWMLARRRLSRMVGQQRVFSGTRPKLEVKHLGKIASRTILHIVGNSLPHKVVGYTIRTGAIVEAQASLGLEPHVLTPPGFPSGSKARVETVSGVVHHRLDGDDTGGSRYDLRLQRFAEQAVPVVEEIRPSILHAASDFKNGLVTLALGEAFGIPVVYEMRGFLEETWKAQRSARALTEAEHYRGRRECEDECMRKADHIVTIASSMKKQIVDRGFDQHKVTVIPNGVDVERFVRRRPSGEAARALGLSEGEPVVGYVSSLRSLEGIDFLLRAVEVLLTARDIRLVIVGDGPDQSRLRQIASDLSLGDRCVFTGHVAPGKVRDFLEAMDVFVVPRRDEMVCRLVAPLKPLEAMAMGVPVVASDLPALGEMVREGETGFLAPSEDAQGLADVIAGVLDDEARARAIAQNARDWVYETRTWQRLVKRYLDVYGSISSSLVS